jgi:hypothetical protein
MTEPPHAALLFSPVAVHLPVACCERRRNVAQRSIEILIGRLITDESFRSGFLADAVTALTHFMDSGCELTRLEIDAVRATPAHLCGIASQSTSIRAFRKCHSTHRRNVWRRSKSAHT